MIYHYSIKKRAFIFSSLMSLIILLLMFYAAYKVAYHETEEILDQRLKTTAEWLALTQTIPVQSRYDYKKHYHEEDIFVDICLYADMVKASPNGIVLKQHKEKAGFYRYYNQQDMAFIAYIIPLPDRQIQVAQPLEVRRILSFELAGAMLIPYLVMLPFVFILLYIGINRALKPLEYLQKEFSRRQYHDLTALDIQHYPQELSGIIAEVNALFQRIEQAQQQQNDFISHAAHELRSPLTALNLQVKLLEKQYPQSQAVQDVLLAIKRMQHMVQQLLDLAKQEDTQLQLTDVDMTQLLKQVIEDLYPLMAEKNIDLALHGFDEDHILTMDRHAAYLIFRNLIDNAIKYTPQNGQVEITIKFSVQALQITIEDSGLGIATEEYDKIMQKFYRIHNVGIGSGLGLAIVEKSLQRLNAQMTFATSQKLGGLCVCVIFPGSSDK